MCLVLSPADISAVWLIGTGSRRVGFSLSVCLSVCLSSFVCLCVCPSVLALGPGNDGIALADCYGCLFAAILRHWAPQIQPRLKARSNWKNDINCVLNMYPVLLYICKRLMIARHSITPCQAKLPLTIMCCTEILPAQLRLLFVYQTHINTIVWYRLICTGTPLLATR